MKKLIITLLFPTIAFSQVGINTTTPTNTLDINGTLRVRDIPLVTTAEYIIVTNADGVHRKILLSSLSQNAGTCPNFNRSQSNGYFLLFESSSSIQNPNNTLVIDGKNFVSAGTWISNNTYYFSYSNTSGTVLNINSPFTVQFGTQTCNY